MRGLPPARLLELTGVPGARRPAAGDAAAAAAAPGLRGTFDSPPGAGLRDAAAGLRLFAAGLRPLDGVRGLLRTGRDGDDISTLVLCETAARR